jgi:ANTAR domain
MSGRHDRADAGAQERPGPTGVPGHTTRPAQPPGTPAPASQGSGPADEGHTAPLEAVARRTPTGWRVGDEEVPDLTSAMVLADLLAAELSAEEQAELDTAAAQGTAPGSPDPLSPAAPAPAGSPDPLRAAAPAGADARNTAARNTGPNDRPGQRAVAAAPEPAPRKPHRGAHRATDGALATEVAEAEQLKETVAQLERALTVRVRVEQAIGVLAERHRLRPRQAFELLRSASRARGQRIMETASQVIASASNPLLRLPEELAKPPMPRRMPRRSRGEA